MLELQRGCTSHWSRENINPNNCPPFNCRRAQHEQVHDNVPTLLLQCGVQNTHNQNFACRSHRRLCPPMRVLQSAGDTSTSDCTSPFSPESQIPEKYTDAGSPVVQADELDTTVKETVQTMESYV